MPTPPPSPATDEPAADRLDEVLELLYEIRAMQSFDSRIRAVLYREYVKIVLGRHEARIRREIAEQVHGVIMLMYEMERRRSLW